MVVVATKWAERCRRYADGLIEPLREVAKAHGYALAVHGTLARDIDLIAVPWTADAAPARTLAEAIRAEAERVVGYADHNPMDRDEFFRVGSPGLKPHGRLSWAYHLGGGPYIDLAVMPRTHPPEPVMILDADAPDGFRPGRWAE